MIAPVVETLHMPHLDESRSYTSTEKDILLIIQATAAFVEKKDRSAALHTIAFHCHVSALYDKAHSRR